MTTTAPFFYQSSIVNFVKVDLDNPLHKELFALCSFSGVNSGDVKQATKLMKKIEGFKPSLSLNNTTAWGSDLFIMTKPVSEN
jgi:hypothetical protein